MRYRIFFDWQLRTVIPPQFDEARHFQEGRAAVRKGERWFFIDRNGRELPDALPAEKRSYRDVGDFCDGMARVSTRNVELWSEYEFDDFARAGISGYIDKTGKEVAVPQYILAQDFAHGAALAAKGRWVPCHPRYDEGGPGYYGNAERWGALERTGTGVTLRAVFRQRYYNGTLKEGKVYLDRKKGRTHYGAALSFAKYAERVPVIPAGGGTRREDHTKISA